MVLNEKQKRFADEYLIDLNATQAAIRAGYSAKTAQEQGARLLSNDMVQAAIQTAIKRRQRRTEVTQDMVLREYARLAFFDPRKLFEADGKPKDIADLDDDTAAALAGLDMQELYDENGDGKTFVSHVKKYKLANKLGALDSLGKHLGLFDGRGGQAQQENNLLAAIKQSGEGLGGIELPEVQPTAAADADVVE